MIRLDTDCARRGSVTRVRVILQNDRNTAQRVQLRSTLEGPVWPPRSGPLVVPEWSDSGWEGTVPAGRTRGVGFATSAPPSDDPVELSSVERADRNTADVDSVLEELDHPSPPAEIVKTDV